MSRKLLAIVFGAVFLFIGAIVALVFALVIGIFKLMDRTDAHVCGMAYVKRSDAAAKLVGAPMEQKGFTGGSSNDTNGELSERITFTVGGPLGEAFVVSEGKRSQLESELTVRIGREGNTQTVYSGPFDCPELHAK